MSSRLARLLSWAGVLLFLSGMLARPVAALEPHAGTSPLSLVEYWQFVDHTHEVLQNLTSATPEQTRTALSNLADQWQAVQQVQLEDGSLIPLDNSYLVTALRAGDRQPAIKLVEALLQAHKRYPSRLFSTSDLAKLDTILARPEFQWPEAKLNPLQAWLQKVWEWVLKTLNRIIDWLNKLFGSRSGGIGVPGAQAFPTLMAILLVFVIGYILWGMFSDLASESRLQAGADEADEILTSEKAFARAQTLSRGGDYRSAVRYLYLSSLLVLDERGLLRYDRSKTNREYLRSISGSPELSEPLRDVIDVFDNVWYGYHSLDQESFEHYSEHVEELKEKKQP